jgi:hypothetical protein
VWWSKRTSAPQLIMAFSIDVPEPASLALFSAGLLGLFGLRRRR